MHIWAKFTFFSPENDPFKKRKKERKKEKDPQQYTEMCLGVPVHAYKASRCIDLIVSTVWMQTNCIQILTFCFKSSTKVPIYISEWNLLHANYDNKEK